MTVQVRNKWGVIWRHSVFITIVDNGSPTGVSAGSDVPYASSVRPTTASEIPKAFASFAEESISFSAKILSILQGIKQGFRIE